MRLSIVASLICMVIGATLPARAAEQVRIQMSALRWHMLEPDSLGPRGQAEFLYKEGFPQGVLLLKAGSAALDGLTFRNGTIEYDFKPLSADMPGLQFRVSGPERKQQGEEVYERLFGDERASNDGIQYAPMINGFMLWNVYPQYQSAAPLVDGWNHVRIVVSGQRMKVFINRLPDAVLSIGNLESGSRSGAIHFRGPAAFANLVITPDEVGELPPQPEIDPLAQDAGIVRHWQMSPLEPLLKGVTPRYPQMPQAATAWRSLTAERGGLLNLNRQFVASDDPPSLVWLRFRVRASRPETRAASLGWIGQTWIYVNGKLLTSGKNFYYPENERRDPDGRLAYANGSFEVPLQAGSNEIAIALYASVHDDYRARTRYGWGLQMRFSNPHGLFFEGTSAK